LLRPAGILPFGVIAKRGVVAEFDEEMGFGTAYGVYRMRQLL